MEKLAHLTVDGGVEYDGGVVDGGVGHSLIQQSDIAAIASGDFYIWINGTQPVTWEYSGFEQHGTPTSPFPFARLASVTSQSVTYLYHQINGTMFAVEQWDVTDGTWGPTEYIPVTGL